MYMYMYIKAYKCQNILLPEKIFSYAFLLFPIIEAWKYQKINSERQWMRGELELEQFKLEFFVGEAKKEGQKKEA